MNAKRDYQAETRLRRKRMAVGQTLVTSMVQLRSLSETAALMGCSREYVKFLEKQALWKVRQRMLEQTRT